MILDCKNTGDLSNHVIAIIKADAHFGCSAFTFFALLGGTGFDAKKVTKKNQETIDIQHDCFNCPDWAAVLL